MDRAIVPGSARPVASITECRPELQELHALWTRLRGARRMPSRGDFDPLEVPRLLSRIYLVDCLPENPPERRYRVRLQGTEEVRTLGADWTGRFLHEVADRETADRLVAVAELVATSRQPRMSTGALYWIPETPFYHFESLLLPLSPDDDVVNMILGITVVF